MAGIANLKPFTKGMSGNPAGKPKHDRDAKALAKKNCHAAMSKLIELLEDEDKRVVLAAAKEILDRGMGRVAQAADDSDGKGGGLTINIVRFEEPAKPQIEATSVRIKDFADGLGH